MTFTSENFGAQTSSHPRQNLSDPGREFTCQKRQRKCQREFYMAQSVLARIRTGAEKGTACESDSSLAMTSA
jgi:hypothetical protein